MDETRKARLAQIRNNMAGDAPAPGVADAFTRLINNTPELIMNLMTTRADLMKHMFDPRRDIYDECGYPKIITLEQYRQMYDRELGARVVDVYPAETWKEFPEIYEDPNPDNVTPFEEALTTLDNQHHLLHFMQRIDELSGIGHYGVLLWGFDDGKDLMEPVEGYETWSEATGKPSVTKGGTATRGILFIRALDESLVRIASYEADIRNPRYGLPAYYNITLADTRDVNGNTTATPPGFTDVKVHWSRVTHIADNRKTSEVLGTPRMKPVWNRLYDLTKILGGTGEMYWRGGFPGVSLETQPGMEGAEVDEDATRQMMFDYMNGLQRYIALTGMSAKSLAPQIADPTSSFETEIKAICVTIGVPFRVFMGIEEGVVSGDQATKAWETRLKNRQARYVTPMIINPVLQRLVDAGVLPAPAEPMGWTVEWPEMGAMDEAAEAAVSVQKTEALSKYVAGGVDMLIPPMEYLTLILGLDDKTAQSIMDAAVTHIEEGNTIQAAAAEATADIEVDKAAKLAAQAPDPDPVVPGTPPQPGGKQAPVAKEK